MQPDAAPALVAAVLRLLRAAAAERLEPDAAVARLQTLRAAHPDEDLELLWQREPYDGRVHYDALIRDDARGTIQLSWCAPQAVPFLLRGVQRYDEWDVVRVNGVMLSVSETVEALEFLWQEVRLLDRIVDACIVKGELEREPVPIDDETLQLALDQFRVTRGLHSAAATERWLAERGLTHEALEGIVADEVRLMLLRRRVTAPALAQRFLQEPRAFDRVTFTHFQVGTQAEAMRLMDEISRGRELAIVAEEWLAANGGGALQVVTTFRHCLVGAPQQLQPGQLVTCRLDERAWSVARIRALTPANVDEATCREEVERVLFDEWLAERRRSAQIDWNWGPELADAAAPDEAAPAQRFASGEA
jgi:putative peptide maturation system protein